MRDRPRARRSNPSLAAGIPIRVVVDVEEMSPFGGISAWSGDEPPVVEPFMSLTVKETAAPFANVLVESFTARMHFVPGKPRQADKKVHVSGNVERGQ